MVDFPKRAFTEFGRDLVSADLAGASRGQTAVRNIGHWDCGFADNSSEMRLPKEVEAAEREWRDATPEEKPEARRRFLDALHRFSVLVFEGRILAKRL